MRVLRLLSVTLWLQLKLRSRSAFDGLLSLVWPLFYATVVFLMFRAGGAAGPALLAAAMGASVMGVWSATSATAAMALQHERRQGTLELLVAAPAPFPLLIFPVTLSMAMVGAYSMVVTLLWGRVVFGIHIVVRHPSAFVVAVLATVVAVGSMGFLLAVSTVRYRAAWALGAALELPVWLICGFLAPLSALPDWVRPISWLLAPTWGMSAIRATTEGAGALGYLAACVVLTGVYGLLGTVVAGRMEHAARSRATLTLT